MSLHGSSSFVALKKEKKDNKNPPRLAIASEGVGCRCCRGCRRRQITTTSLHGSLLLLSFVALKKKEKKDNKNPPRLAMAGEGVGCCRCHGRRRRQTTTTSLHGPLSSL